MLLAFRFILSLSLGLAALLVPSRSMAHEHMEYVARALRIPSQDAPKIDGVLDEAAWRRGGALSGFIQRDPFPGVPASEKSQVHILFDEGNLYVGCRLFHSSPEHILRELGRREAIGNSDQIALYFDTFHNHRAGYRFAVNPYGVQADAQIFNDDQNDSSWDAVWESAAGVDSLGWVAEFRIPFFNLRFPEREEQVWGFNLVRAIRYKAESGSWKPISIHDQGKVRMSRLGHLVGLKGIRRGRNIELYPYGLTGFSQKRGHGRSGTSDTGFDARYGVTSNTTMDVTVNPDFAQVEADVLEINLTRFPTRFPEKRKFFLEGTGIFNTPVSLFYSRRIGAKGDILWGTKLTGRAARGGLEYGLLAGQTGDWTYLGVQKEDPSKENALYGVARVKKGFSNGSSIGAMYTTKSIRGNVRRHIGGLDGRFLIGQVHRATFQAAWSHSPGLTSNNRYCSIGLFRFANPWTFRITAHRTDPNYDINSTGFLAKEKHRGQERIRTVLICNPLVQKKGIRQITIFSSWLVGRDLLTQAYLDAWRQSNPDLPILNRYESGGLRPVHWLLDQSYGIRTTQEMNLSWWYGLGRTNELTHTYRQTNQGFVFSSPKTGKWQKVALNLNLSWGDFYNFSQKHLGRTRRIGGHLRSWVKSNLGLQVSGNYSETFDPDGTRDGKHFRLTVRNTLLVTRNLFVRLFTQGRWSSTYYGAETASNRYLLSLLLGWELRPGSWFYLAYNEGREDLEDFGDPQAEKRDFWMTSRTLAAKLQYAFFH